KYLLALKALLRAYSIDKENATLHNDIIRFHLAVSDNKEINPTINQVIASEKVTLIPENMSLVEFNERFLERNKSISHLLAGAEALYSIDPERKQEAETLLLMVDSEKYASTRTLENCIKVYETLKSTFSSSKAEEFRVKCKEWFPISTYFCDDLE
ncbi:8183_t:CDS:2, partial [Gigaspora rosea]